MSRVTNPMGLKIMVCQPNKSISEGVWIRNVVYRELFQDHCVTQQVSLDESIDDICSLLNETFPSSQMEFTSPLCDFLAFLKRVSDTNESGKCKVIKLHKFNDTTVFPLEVTESRMDTHTRGPIPDPNAYLMA